KTIADAQGYQADDTKGAIEKSPPKGNATEMPGQQGEGNNQQTGDHTKLDHPAIAHRIAVHTYKQYGKKEMCKSQPVETIEQKRIAYIGLRKAMRDPCHPVANSRARRKRPAQPLGTRHHRYGADTTYYESYDKK